MHFRHQCPGHKRTEHGFWFGCVFFFLSIISNEFRFLIGIRYGRQLNVVSFCFQLLHWCTFDTSNHVASRKEKKKTYGTMLREWEEMQGIKFGCVIKIKNSDRKVIKFLISSHRPIKFRRFFFILAEGSFFSLSHTLSTFFFRLRSRKKRKLSIRNCGQRMLNEINMLLVVWMPQIAWFEKEKKKNLFMEVHAHGDYWEQEYV